MGNNLRGVASHLVTGAAGFIGSHLVDSLLSSGARVEGWDNLSRGRLENLAAAINNPRFQFRQVEMTDPNTVQRSLSIEQTGTVWHLVANSDIQAGVANPNVDLNDTFLTTFNILSAMKEKGVRRIAFASSSAVYGVHHKPLTEETGPLFPISNYGAMKLASEALISAAVESFLQNAWIFRFPNVIGSRATHGIIFDLLTKLCSSPDDLEVLGDGKQQKPYLHVTELIDAMATITQRVSEPLSCFNIGPPDNGATVLQIAQAVQRSAAPCTPIRLTGGSKGWVGDVPRFQYSIEKLGKMGWRPKLTSLQAVELAVEEIRKEFAQPNRATRCNS